MNWHGVSSNGKSLKQIANACVNAEYRIGLSGTFPDERTADWFTLIGATGPIVEYSTYKKLQEDGHIAKLKIFNIILQYNKQTKLDVYNKCLKDYKEETDYVNGNINRVKFIAKMAQNLNNNVLILFTKIEKHGHVLRDIISQEVSGKKIIYIDGSTPIQEREKMRMIAEKENNLIIIASYGTLSTGVNIKNLHYLIFASGYKSKYKVIQSIGRALRKKEGKEFATLYDIVDDLSFVDKKNGIKFINYSMKHHLERLKLYDKENFDYKSIKFKI